VDLFAIVGTIVAISTLYGIVATIRRKRQLKKHLIHIDNLKRQFYSNEAKYLDKLYEKKQEIQNLLIENKLDESNYNLLDKAISLQMKNVRKSHSSPAQSKNGAPINNLRKTAEDQ